MAFIINDESTDFPPVSLADPDGLLAIGGSLTFDRLMNAYRRGIFPWYNEDEPVCWYCPDPRFVLFPDQIKVSHSMKKLLKNEAFHFTIDRAFSEVIKHCRNTKRKDNAGTWITNEIEEAYIMLHEKGMAHSSEVWKDGRLVGGLYGVQMGKVFFGESMFSLESNASKFAFIKHVERMIADGVALIDCQVYTAHLETLGAEFIPRSLFINLLNNLIG
ncbi:MAG: leucyl/phenylalanyl-tRNA--protein transferase [Ginsengibacter sp.]